MIHRAAVFAVPFLVSICLSLATLGSHAYWQDSGFFLTAVKELGVLYPPGFVLYEMLCFLWTKLLFFVDFTVAVHLFSSICAALAAGTIAIAARDLLRSRGRLFRVTEEDPGELADACGMAAGVLLACGFTFWSTAIYAKGYSLHYLTLALLLWAMIRADQSGKPRDFAIVAALIGTAWQAHPSSALAGAALLLYVGVHARSLGWKVVAGRIGIAGACALAPTLLLLPWLASRDSWLVLGGAGGAGELLRYITGRRFLDAEGMFGLDAGRVASFGRYLWEELPGPGVVLALAGLGLLAARRRLLFWGILAWMVPYAAVTILFKMEGQHDCWFVGAWLPLYLALAVGLMELGRRAGAHARTIVLAAAAAGAAWSMAANFPDVSQRDYVLAEMYGRILLENVDPGATLVVEGDDAIALTSYLHRVRGMRPDVVLVSANFLGSRWYEDLLLRRHPFLKRPGELPSAAPAGSPGRRTGPIAAFLNAQADLGRPLFCQQVVPPELIRPDYVLVPAGALWKLVPQRKSPAVDARYWKFPIEPEQVRQKARRARAQRMQAVPGGITVEPERYEERLVALILMARYHLAIGRMGEGQFLAAATLCESILNQDNPFRDRPEIVHLYAIALLAAGDTKKAEPALRRSAEISVLPRNKATACCYLGEIARKRGDEAEAQRWFRLGLETPALDEASRREIETRFKSGQR